MSKNNQIDVQLRSNLAQAQILLEQINAAVSAGDWSTAQTRFAEFEGKAQRMPAPQLNHPDISPVLQDFFDFYRVQLRRSINEQSLMQSRIAINQLFGIVGEQRARFGVRNTPLEFQRLNFLIHEIEIWSQSNDEEMLRVRINAFRDAWKETRPMIVARRNGAEQIRHFEELVDKLLASGQPPEITSLIPELNKEFDRMSSLFQRAIRPTVTPSG